MNTSPCSSSAFFGRKIKIDVFTRASARLKASPGSEIMPAIMKTLRMKSRVSAYDSPDRMESSITARILPSSATSSRYLSRNITELSSDLERAAIPPMSYWFITVCCSWLSREYFIEKGGFDRITSNRLSSVTSISRKYSISSSNSRLPLPTRPIRLSKHQQNRCYFRRHRADTCSSERYGELADRSPRRYRSTTYS